MAGEPAPTQKEREVLIALSRVNPGVGYQLAATRFNRNTLNDRISRLISKGLLRRDATTGRYLLTDAAVALLLPEQRAG